MLSRNRSVVTPSERAHAPCNERASWVTNKYSSLNCYTGTVSGTLMAEMKKKACRMRDGKYIRKYGMTTMGMGM